MIIETKVHTCRKCHSKALIRNGKNTCGNQQYHCKTCGTYGVLEPHERFTEEEKDAIIKAYQERSSMRGIERTHGVCRQTVSAWLKEKAEQLPSLDATLVPIDPEQTPVLELDELCSFVFKKTTKYGSGLPGAEQPEKSSLMRVVIAVKTRAESFGIAYRPLIKKPWFSLIIGKRIKLLFRMSSVILLAKKQEKQPMLSVGIIPCGNT